MKPTPPMPPSDIPQALDMRKGLVEMIARMDAEIERVEGGLAQMRKSRRGTKETLAELDRLVAEAKRKA